ncbi:hypothetical protein BKA93DRAFT_753875 [Sparassis latifolia]
MPFAGVDCGAIPHCCSANRGLQFPGPTVWFRWTCLQGKFLRHPGVRGLSSQCLLPWQSGQPGTGPFVRMRGVNDRVFENTGLSSIHVVLMWFDGTQVEKPALPLRGNTSAFTSCSDSDEEVDAVPSLDVSPHLVLSTLIACVTARIQSIAKLKSGTALSQRCRWSPTFMLHPAREQLGNTVPRRLNNVLQVTVRKKRLCPHRGIISQRNRVTPYTRRTSGKTGGSEFGIKEAVGCRQFSRGAPVKPKDRHPGDGAVNVHYRHWNPTLIGAYFIPARQELHTRSSLVHQDSQYGEDSCVFANISPFTWQLQLTRLLGMGISTCRKHVVSVARLVITDLRHLSVTFLDSIGTALFHRSAQTFSLSGCYSLTASSEGPQFVSGARANSTLSASRREVLYRTRWDAHTRSSAICPESLTGRPLEAYGAPEHFLRKMSRHIFLGVWPVRSAGT